MNAPAPRCPTCGGSPSPGLIDSASDGKVIRYWCPKGHEFEVPATKPAPAPTSTLGHKWDEQGVCSGCLALRGEGQSDTEPCPAVAPAPSCDHDPECIALDEAGQGHCVPCLLREVAALRTDLCVMREEFLVQETARREADRRAEAAEALLAEAADLLPTNDLADEERYELSERIRAALARKEGP